MVAIHCGNKFFKFNSSNEVELIRIYGNTKSITNWDGENEKERVTVLDKDNKKQSMTVKYLMNNYSPLKPDGLMMFNIVDMDYGQDVIVGLNKLSSPSKLPYAICRQSIFDVFTNMNIINTDTDYFYVGVSISQDSIPAEIQFESVLACKGLHLSLPVAVYLDDTLDDVLKLFSNRKFDEVLFKSKTQLEELYKKQGKVVLGLTTTLKDLLVANTFMYDFRSCFKIIEIPHEVNEESETLSPANIEFLESELHVNIMETYLIKYTREIDINSIKRDHVLVSSAAENFKNVYIVGYDKSDDEYMNNRI